MSALEIILAVLLILSSVILTVVILMQESRQAGLSGASAGGGAIPSSVRIKAEPWRLSSADSRNTSVYSFLCLHSVPHFCFSFSKI